MKSASAPLIALLGDRNRQLRVADLLTLTLLDSSVKRYTGRDHKVTHSGIDYIHNDVLFKRSRIRTVPGLEVDQLDITFFPGTNSTLGGFPFIEGVRRGVLDGARIRLDRGYLSDTGSTTVGALNLFDGRVSNIPEATRTSVKMIGKSDVELLNTKLPRNLFQSRCVHTLYDTGCGLNRESLAVTGTVTGGGTTTSWYSNLSQPDHYFTLGYVYILTGQNAGLYRGVKAYWSTGGGMVLFEPLPYAPAAGDTFKIYPGCDKLKDTCQNKFGNLTHFRGYPYIPVPETLL